MLLITVATTVSPLRRPSALSCRAHISITASPSTSRPCSSAKIARSPSPSKATPAIAPRSTTRAAMRLGMRRAAVQIDVAAIRRRAEQHDVEARALANSLRRHASSSRHWRSRRRALPPQPAGVGQHVAQVVEIRPDRVAWPTGRRVAARSCQSGRRRSSRRAARASSVNFSPRAREDLDAVVLERVVRSRDHRAERDVRRAREIGDGRRRQHTDGLTVAPLARRAVRELAFDPVARLARIAADQQMRAARPPGRARAPAQRRCGARSAGRAATGPPCRERRRSRTDVVPSADRNVDLRWRDARNGHLVRRTRTAQEDCSARVPAPRDRHTP